MPRPVIALLTDFGLHDHYVASMKGVILGIAPEVMLVDITHEIAAQDVLSAAIELHACWRDFPPGSIFVVVVDPGVGTPRRAIGAETANRFFVAPDNGVLTMVFDEQAPSDVVELTNAKYLRPAASRTFEGRDRFAPVAAWLSLGTEISALGAPVGDWVRLSVPTPRAGKHAVVGEILAVDRFGNLISNIGADLLEEFGRSRPPLIRLADRETVPLVGTYAEVPAGSLCALVGSSGRQEVAANGASAARMLGIARGARLVVAADGTALEAAGKA
jgi:S-adenosylmethionine hydrolase